MHTPSEIKESRFIFALILTGLIFLAELGGGLWTGSLALLSDSAHVFALGLRYLALRATALPANEKHTYGYHRLQVLTALVNGSTLFLIAFEILRESWKRFQDPQPILVGPMLAIAVLGLVINLIVAFVLREHDPDDLNTRSAFLHVVGDALASVGVIAVGVTLLFLDLPWLDPLVSVLIGLLILVSSGRVLLESVHILAEDMPKGMTANYGAASMQAIPGVESVHDLHVWTIAPGYITLSGHVTNADQKLSQAGESWRSLKRISMIDLTSSKKRFNLSAATAGRA